MFKEIIIIGTGGFAAELVNYIYDNKEIIIKGYLDIDDTNYKKYNFEEPFLGNEDEYTFTKNQIVYIGIGNNKIRKNIISKLQNQNLVFESFVHKSVLISKSVNIGAGNIVAPNVIIGPKVSIGDFNIINYNSSIAHDCRVLNGNVFCPNVHIAGTCEIGNNNFFSLSSGMIPENKIGNNNKIEAGLIINKNISNNNIVFKNDKIKSLSIYRMEDE